MRLGGRLVVAVILGITCGAGRAQAQDPTPPQAPQNPSSPASQGPSSTATPSFFTNTELSGFVDFYFGYNFNRPGTRQTQLHGFDGQHNAFSLNLAEFAVERKPTADSRGGFRIDLDYGPTTTLIHAGEPGGAGTFQNIGQAYLSYLAPKGNGLQFDFGKFATPIGNEVVKTKDNWNYSRSLVYMLAEPVYHSGMRVAWTANDRVSLATYLVNGWNNVVDNNGGKTVGLQVTLKPTAAVTLIQTYMGGPEQTDNDSDWRHLSDTVLSYTATPKVSLALNYDYGHDTVAGSGVTFQGLAAYLRYQPHAWFAFTPRVEYYNDGDGLTTGTSQTLKEVTLTGEWKNKDGVTMRVEYRRDMSNQPFFLKKADGQVKNQDTLTIGLIYAFSSKQ